MSRPCGWIGMKQSIWIGIPLMQVLFPTQHKVPFISIDLTINSYADSQDNTNNRVYYLLRSFLSSILHFWLIDNCNWLQRQQNKQKTSLLPLLINSPYSCLHRRQKKTTVSNKNLILRVSVTNFTSICPSNHSFFNYDWTVNWYLFDWHWIYNWLAPGYGLLIIYPANNYSK